MGRGLVEYARAIRALLALCAALGLAIMLYVFEQDHNRERDDTVNKITATVWAMSELHFESQRMISAIEAYVNGRTDVEQLRLRFDILWSRVDVANRDAVGLGEILDPVLAGYRSVLETHDPVIFGDTPDSGELFQMAGDITDLVLESREIWSMTFGTQNPTDRFTESPETAARYRRTEYAAMFLIALLMSYVLAEVYFANRGQRMEAALRHEAAEANAAKTRFLANVSHEIRTPLNGILGMASELSETSLTKDQAMCLRVIEQSGNVLLGTINDVLDLSRIEAGQLTVEERPFVLRDLAEGACALYSAQARQKKLYLTLDCQDNLPPVLIGDEFRIRQVLHNLIANAVKFTEQGGVTVRLRPDLDGRRLAIAVQDSGPGIERDAQARIFEPFLQADSGVTRRHGGSGLGLSISRQLCQAMGGDLTVVSRPGHGATFFCDLPLRQASTEEARQVRSEPAAVPALRDLRILVADDNATNRLILSRFLAPTGAQLSFAETGRGVLEQVTETRFDAILMDVQMPVLDGVAATRELRAMERARDQPPTFVVAVTANVLSHQVSSYRAEGMDEVLSKPLSKRDLLALLARRFPQGAARSAQAGREHVRASAS